MPSWPYNLGKLNRPIIEARVFVIAPHMKLSERKLPLVLLLRTYGRRKFLLKRAMKSNSFFSCSLNVWSSLIATRPFVIECIVMGGEGRKCRAVGSRKPSKVSYSNSLAPSKSIEQVSVSFHAPANSLLSSCSINVPAVRAAPRSGEKRKKKRENYAIYIRGYVEENTVNLLPQSLCSSCLQTLS